MLSGSYFDICPLWLGMFIFGLITPSQASADEVAEALKKGEELYYNYHLEPNQLDQAIKLFEQALARHPDDYFILWRLADMYQNYGLTLGDDRKKKMALWDKGLAYGRRAMAVNPAGREGHFYYMANLGTRARLRGLGAIILKVSELKKEMDKALELDPNYPQALVARAQFLAQLPKIFGNREEEILALYHRALQSNPRFVVVYYYLAEIDAKHKRYDAALAKLKKIFECRDPWNQGHLARIVRPQAASLQKEILKKR